MVVKKITKKPISTKKDSSVIIETKRHLDNESSCSSKSNCGMAIFVIILLLLNLIVGVRNMLDLSSLSAWNVESMKVGGKENLELVKQLYNSESYKSQQKAAIMQVLNSFDNPNPQEIIQQQEIPQGNEDELPLEMPTELTQ